MIVWCLTSCLGDPLIHHGRHFGRTQHALCNIRLLVKNGILRLERLADGHQGVAIRFVLINCSLF